MTPKPELVPRKVNADGESRGAILRDALEAAYFDLCQGKPVKQVIKAIGDVLNDDAAIRGRFSGT